MLYGISFVFAGGLCLTIAPPDRQLWVLLMTFVGMIMTVSTMYLKAPWERK